MDVKKIVEVINVEGRQGPKDLKSKEVYEWVKRKINISYEQYLKILKENSIEDKDRNAFFVILKNGQYKLFKSCEDEIRKYVCYVIRENPNITSSEAKKKLKLIYQEYTIIDLMDQKNLSSEQDIIDQTIRNILVSNYFKVKNNILFNRSIIKPFTYTLTEEGYKLASLVDEILSETKNNTNNDIQNIEIGKKIDFYTEKELEEIFEANKNFNLYDKFDALTLSKGRIPTDPKIKSTRFYQTNFCCEVNHDHKTFKSVIYPNFVLGHHLVPMAVQKNFASINLDCIDNMVSLCPNCHYQIHYGTREAKKEIFDKIVSNRKDDLLKIGFTEPILKVIFDTYY